MNYFIKIKACPVISTSMVSVVINHNKTIYLPGLLARQTRLFSNVAIYFFIRVDKVGKDDETTLFLFW